MRAKRGDKRADHFREGEKYWRNMPEYVSNDLRSLKSLPVYFSNAADRQTFAKLINQTITEQTRYLFYPDIEDLYTVNTTAYVDDPFEEVAKPVYPVYVISKGRWKYRQTAKSLEKIGVPYHIVVEPQEFEEYAKVIDPSKILVLPFSNLGQGSIPARNWVWEHSISIGAKRHWILDDNINRFWRMNHNMKLEAQTGAIFRAAEDFVERYKNVALAGFNYYMFAARKLKYPPFYLNTRIYSCILIKNDLPYRWRGRYNEDTDLSLRALKDGWCTVLFNAFLAWKLRTMSMKGGNTDELYKDDGRLKMAQSLVDQHPDVTRITFKFGRYQHQVDYCGFGKNKLQLKPGVVVPEGVNEYGMILQTDNPTIVELSKRPPDTEAYSPEDSEPLLDMFMDEYAEIDCDSDLPQS